MNGAPVHASVSLRLDIPADVAANWLRNTEHEGTILGQEPDDQREAIGEHLEGVVVEELAFLLDYLAGDVDVEADW